MALVVRNARDAEREMRRKRGTMAKSMKDGTLFRWTGSGFQVMVDWMTPRGSVSGLPDGGYAVGIDPSPRERVRVELELAKERVKFLKEILRALDKAAEL